MLKIRLTRATLTLSSSFVVNILSHKLQWDILSYGKFLIFAAERYLHSTELPHFELQHFFRRLLRIRHGFPDP